MNQTPQSKRSMRPALLPVALLMFTAIPTTAGANAACAPKVGSVIAIRADTGKYLTWCLKCQKASVEATVMVVESNPAVTKAQFVVVSLGNGKLALRSLWNNNYVTRCDQCVPGGPAQSLTLHSTQAYSMALVALPNGKCALQTDDGNWVKRCRDCSPGASFPDAAIVAKLTPATDPAAQFDLVVIKAAP